VAASRQNAHHYVNATVLLVGDSGVGKSGLGLRLTGNAFEPTESTHGRHIWLLDAVEIARENGDRETREVFLWDLAGQPGYRVVHQLHLSRADVALVVFDARSEVDAFAGVEYWTRAFDQAHALGRSAGEPARRVLVAARVDRGVIAASRDRIEAELIRGRFDHYLATSAKTGEGIDTLRAAIDELVRWDALPRIASNALFADVKRFIVEEKSAGRLLATGQDLVIGFRRAREGALERTAGTASGDWRLKPSSGV
jgi:small GTP-binding protein